MMAILLIFHHIAWVFIGVEILHAPVVTLVSVKQAQSLNVTQSEENDRLRKREKNGMDYSAGHKHNK